MKSIKNVLLAGLLMAPSAAAQTVVAAGPSTDNWLGFMNVFELDCVAFAFNTAWGVPDLSSSFDDMAGTITMGAAPVMDASDFWYVGAPGTMPGGPGVPGNKCMDATLYNEIQDDTLAGTTFTFTGTVLSNTLTGPHIAEIFIRDFEPGFASFDSANIPATPGPFSISLNLQAGAGRTIQWGFQMIGPNAWPGDEGAFGTVVFGQGFPDAAFGEFCNGDGGDQMGCTNCPCGNNAAPGTMGGCLNSAGNSARLVGSGSASLAGDTLRFEVNTATPTTFGILQSANNRLPNMGPCAPGSGILSGVVDGLRCVGGAALRHGTRATDSNGDIGVTNNGWGPPNGPPGGLISTNGFVAGQTRHFQVFYREDVALGCQSGQNTTQGVTVTFVM